ncbi:magnesium-translocating P-type ATPase [Candidatus Woesearchaeota archaeon]|nr:magnesium-translocating P-type ATPase [Candidatus Woesearchaeota archaeon]
MKKVAPTNSTDDRKKFHNGTKKLQSWDFDPLSATNEQLFDKMGTSVRGLSDEEAKHRLQEYGYNEPARKKKRQLIFQIFSKFLNPLVIILFIIAFFSLFFGERISALLVTLMALISVFLSFFQEYRANRDAEKLTEIVKVTATVHRSGKVLEVKINEIVPGDIVDLFAGDMIPADIRLISCKDLFINQSSLTGESFPVEKDAAPLDPTGKSISDQKNMAFMGSSVVSGTALGVVIKTGISTQFGELSRRLSAMTVQSSFDKGVQKFVWLMIKIMIALVLVIFAINAFTKGDWVAALLFSLSVAVGLTPEMLPMLVTLNLSKGAIAMSKKEVIVKRLNTIQSFGAMDVLCSDKTGTLTEDKIVLERHCNIMGIEEEEVLKLAYINSFYQTGLKSLLDRAILKHDKLVVKQYTKVDEVPFDFSRRIMSVVVDMDQKHRLIAKGSTEEIYKRCTSYEFNGTLNKIDEKTLERLRVQYHQLGENGFRVVAIAYKDFTAKKKAYSRDDECDMVLKGYIAFLDPPKSTAKKTIVLLNKLGIKFKVLTGDNEIVTRKICNDVGIDTTRIVTGDEVEKATDADLKSVVEKVSVFARLAPLQKERVINILRQNGHIVGYLGDGINDTAALKAADVGISVNNAVDIAKESADIILLKKSLTILESGVIEGRKTFGNILKYVKMGASSNFGNMFSMTGASLLLPFLPMLPIQILLNNFLYDVSQVAIPSDDVDPEYLLKERPWNIAYIKKFIFVIGPISSIFDFITFGVLIWGFHADASLFHTGWFLESLCTQTLVIHIIRTGKVPFVESKASSFLGFMSLYIITLGLILPFTPLGAYFGFVMPPLIYFPVLLGIVAAYLCTVQLVKSWFIKKYGYE